MLAAGTITASNLSILGDFVTLNTITSNTEQMVIQNAGTGPALKVTQTGAHPIADFYDDGQVLAMRIADGGNVGIGTATPTSKLHVQGGVTLTGFVGIGTTNPLNQLEVYGNTSIINASNRSILSITQLNTGTGDNCDLRLINYNTTNSSYDITTQIRGEANGDSSIVSNKTYGDLVFQNPNSYTRMSITPTGNVGIGTTNPLAIMHINNTGAIIIPSGTTEQQPSVAYAGMIRYNITSKTIEFYNGSTWTSIRASSDVYNVYQVNNILHLDPSEIRSYSSGSVWYDLSLAKSHATGTNFTFNSSAPENFNFNGTSTYFDITLTNPAGAWVHSISFWMQLSIPQSSIVGLMDPFQIGSSTNGSTYSAIDLSSTTHNWYFYSNDTPFTYTFNQGQWYHLALTYNGGVASPANKKLYINNVNVALTGTNTTPLNIAANALMSIGRDRTRNISYFRGKIGNFMIYNEVLSVAAIDQNFTALRSRYGL
jgi:hypothetical protein